MQTQGAGDWAPTRDGRSLFFQQIAGPAMSRAPTVVFDSGIGPKLRAAINLSHAVRAAQSPQGRHVLAPRSGHRFPLTDARLIADEIKRVVEAAA